jgi:hypothetical protein
MSDAPEVPLTPTRPEAPSSSKEGGNADAAHRTITEADDKHTETSAVTPQQKDTGTAEEVDATDRTDGEDRGDDEEEEEVLRSAEEAESIFMELSRSTPRMIKALEAVQEEVLTDEEKAQRAVARRAKMQEDAKAAMARFESMSEEEKSDPLNQGEMELYRWVACERRAGRPVST